MDTREIPPRYMPFWLYKYFTQSPLEESYNIL